MRRMMLALVVSSASGCVDVDFLEGVRCKSSTDCGRKLECEQGFCGGCPEEGLLADGSCGCPGDRIFDCRVFDAAPYCMPMCPTRRDRCAVALVREGGERETLVACEDAEAATQACFTIEVGSTACAEGEDELRLTAADGMPTALVANCPPRDDERFECPGG